MADNAQYEAYAEDKGKGVRYGYSRDKGWVAIGRVAPEKPSLWQRANTGLLTPDDFSKAIFGRDLGVDKLSEFSKGNPGQGPIENALKTFVAGTGKDIAGTLSSMTSPASIATAGLGRLARAPGAIGTIAKSLLTASGLSYGAKGAQQVAEGIKEGVTTPEGAQKTLSGAAATAGAAPAVTQAGRAGMSLFTRGGTGERAFIAALRPPAKEASSVRSAFRYAQPDLEKANIKDFNDLRDFSESQRKGAAILLSNQIVGKNPTAGRIDALAVGNAVRDRVTSLMKVRANLSGQLPREGRMIMSEADNIEQNLLRKPLSIAEAEQVVQDINQELTKFRKLPPADQAMAIRRGDPVSVMTAVKEELQSQIESKIANYGNLKQRYAVYKQLQDNAERRLNELDKASGNISWTDRRTAEGLGGALGALFSGQYLRGIADILAGRAAGDIMLDRANRPEAMLRRGVNPPKPVPFSGQVVQPIALGGQQ